MSDQSSTPESGDPNISGPGLEGAGNRSVRLRIDDSKIENVYANAFRTTATAEELSLDLGVNSLRPSTREENAIDVVFESSTRLIMNYYMAKRLALALGRLVRNYEQRFGELELDPKKRAQFGATGDIAESDGE